MTKKLEELLNLPDSKEIIDQEKAKAKTKEKAVVEQKEDFRDIAELDKINAALPQVKGLGEMDADELWETTMDPDTRTLLQVTVDEVSIANNIFSVLMGEHVESRKGFIQNNAHDVRFLDI